MVFGHHVLYRQKSELIFRCTDVYSKILTNDTYKL